MSHRAGATPFPMPSKPEEIALPKAFPAVASGGLESAPVDLAESCLTNRTDFA
jgi:hypothetical protein